MLNLKELEYATKGKYINGNLEFIPREYIIDSRHVNEKTFFIPIVGKKIDGHEFIIDTVKKGAVGFFINADYKNKDEVVKTCININKDICIIEVKDTKEALYMAGEYNRNKHINIPVIAVTGSVGKTSTREMIASVLATEKKVLVTKYNYNSLIGAPIMALEIGNQDVCVLEIGTDFVGEIERLSNLTKPDVGVITIIGSAHIGVFGSREGIFNEKFQITTHIKEESLLVVNGDDDFLQKIDNTEKYEVIYFKDSDILEFSEKEYITFKTKIYKEIEEIKLNALGLHNVKNAICAIKIAEKFGITKENIIKGISNYKNFTRRMEKIHLKNNIILIDDTYNASIDSMKSGLKTVNNIKERRKIAVLGDMLELGDMSKELHYEVGKMFKDLNFEKLMLLGNESKNIAKGAKRIC